MYLPRVRWADVDGRVDEALMTMLIACGRSGPADTLGRKVVYGMTKMNEPYIKLSLLSCVAVL
jgi:hypothetical protein